MFSAIGQLVLLSLFFTFGCANHPIRLEANLLQPYSYDLERVEPFKPPYVSVYTQGDKKLVFVAAAHQLGPDSPTFRTILSAFESHRPQFIIVEGRPFSTISDPQALGRVRVCADKKFEGCSEDTYALYLAASQNVPYAYGEPTNNAILESLQLSGNSEADLILFYGVRQIPQWKREGAKSDSELKAKLETALPVFAKQLGAKTELNFKSFGELFQRRMGTPLRFATIDTETVSPQVGKSPSWLNLISHEVGLVRDTFLVQQIEARLNAFKTVLVVYGSGHLVSQRALLQKAFPVLQSEQPFP